MSIQIDPEHPAYKPFFAYRDIEAKMKETVAQGENDTGLRAFFLAAIARFGPRQAFVRICVQIVGQRDASGDLVLTPKSWFAKIGRAVTKLIAKEPALGQLVSSPDKFPSKSRLQTVMHAELKSFAATVPEHSHFRAEGCYRTPSPQHQVARHLRAALDERN